MNAWTGVQNQNTERLNLVLIGRAELNAVGAAQRHRSLLSLSRFFGPKRRCMPATT